jgi:hypothetical protein
MMAVYNFANLLTAVPFSPTTGAATAATQSKYKVESENKVAAAVTETFQDVTKAHFARLQQVQEAIFEVETQALCLVEFCEHIPGFKQTKDGLEGLNGAATIKYLDKWLSANAEVAAMTSLRINRAGLSGTLPPQIKYFKKLIRLDLSENLLTAIPNELGCLKDLKFLNLSKNRIFQLPITLCFLLQLEEFHMDDNCLQSLPMGLKECQHLKVLSMSGNFMKNASEQIKKFSKVPAVLNLADNQPAPVQQRSNTQAGLSFNL